MKVAVLDYGLSNLKSIQNSLNFLDVPYVFVDKYQDCKEFSHIILPGVGAFKDGMTGLSTRELDKFLFDAASQKLPILGICLGMQLLLSKSYEFGETSGLDLIPGEVCGFQVEKKDGKYLKKVPHIGWNQINEADILWDGTILDNLIDNSMYFVHSFYCRVDSNDHQLATTSYNGVDFASVIKRDNIFGCQFHPEKSGDAGIHILKCFLTRSH